MAQISTPATSSTRFAGFLSRRGRAIATIAAVCLTAGLVLSGRIEPSVRVSTVTLAGCTPALHFAPKSPGPHPIALLAHGYSATKEYLFRYGEALAAAGFECYDVEQPGHGTSPQAYSFMESVPPYLP